MSDKKFCYSGKRPTKRMKPGPKPKKSTGIMK
jgi:hypothetical protein